MILPKTNENPYQLNQGPKLRSKYIKDKIS